MPSGPDANDVNSSASAEKAKGGANSISSLGDAETKLEKLPASSESSSPSKKDGSVTAAAAAAPCSPEGKTKEAQATASTNEEDADEIDEAEAHADNLRRKRDREGSLEPSLSSQQGLTATDSIPSKKNRLQDTVIGEEQTASSSSANAPSSPTLRSGAEGEKVGQIRKRVEDLSWKQRKEGGRDGEEERSDDKTENGGDTTGERVTAAAAAAEAAETIEQPKRTQATFASFSQKPSAFAAASSVQKEGSDVFSTESTEQKDKSPSPSGTSRTQPTFSSFSKSSSPFSSASNVAGPSWLAGKSSTTTSATPGGGIRPSTLGSVGGADSEKLTATPSPSHKDASPVPVASSGGKQLGFGAFASGKSFASRNSSPGTTSGDKAEKGEEGEESRQGKSFDEVLKQGKEQTDEGQETAKISTQFDHAQTDLRTGEEDERTLTSARAKLYTMAEDKSWKERGTGTIRCNVAKEMGGTARLVMRAEGVLRLILNINLFKGMKINLEQDKFLRIVAMEDEKLVHFVIKFANQAQAGNFYRIVKQMIPVDVGGEQHA